MGCSLFHFTFMCFLFQLLLLHNLMLIQSQPLCHDHEISALLQLKENLIVNKSASLSPLAYPKVASWKLGANYSDCCLWDGVECDANIGHVISLDLSSSCLYGSLNSNSSLFRLVHLQRLNLADNNFNYSRIPSQVRVLSRLTYLNLSSSQFSGQIPLEVSHLSLLSSLDLSRIYYDLYSSSRDYLLELNELSLTILVENLTRLQELNLSGVNISSVVPDLLGNVSSLKSLYLRDCGLRGDFPIGIFKLPNLQALDVSYNAYLTGNFPNSIGNLQSLTQLKLSHCNFSGSIPSSIGNLTQLSVLVIWRNQLIGLIPSSIGNLTELFVLDFGYNQLTAPIPSSFGNLTQLNTLYLDGNHFTGPILSSIGILAQLNTLYLSYNHLTGPIPSSFGNLTQLKTLYLHSNHLTGPIPSSFGNLIQLNVLNLKDNHFTGPIPSSIGNLTQLFELDLTNCNTFVDFVTVFKLKNLSFLALSGNQISFEERLSNATLPRFSYLALSSCNLSKFPDFLRSQQQIEYLDLSQNNIQGQVPEWMWKISKKSLTIIDLSNNFLKGFSQNPIILPWSELRILDLSYNQLEGSLPVPSASTVHFLISNNSLTGNITNLICNMSSLEVLDLSYNNLNGSLPPCLHGFGVSLSVLDLRRNNLQGSIPENWTKGKGLKIINFSQNQFKGGVPRSLVNCRMLEILDLSNNQVRDMFPSWLGILPNLKILSLRANKFHGAILSNKLAYKFPSLQIIDLSGNNFVGKLPFELLSNRKVLKSAYLTYFNVTLESRDGYYWVYIYNYSMILTNKGINEIYERVQESFAVVDLSSNRFVGEISESVRNLEGLHLLNLSNNILTGQIPSSLGKLTELEALDLSHNKLSGKIPQQLTDLTFLGFFNVSHNHLKGPIPQGKQFNTFEKSSFVENLGLCGRPLTKKCEDFDASTLPPVNSHDSAGSLFEFGWRIVLLGYGFGLVVGVIMGHILIARKHEWLMRTFNVRQL